MKAINKIIKRQKEFDKLLKSTPRIVGVEAVNFFKYSWRRKGFIDSGSVNKWAARKTPVVPNRALLVKSGRLRRSIRMIELRRQSVVVGTDVPYAKIHNRGGRVAQTRLVRPYQRRKKSGGFSRVKAHTRRYTANYPQRQFIGKSDFLNRRINAVLTHRLKTIFK